MTAHASDARFAVEWPTAAGVAETLRAYEPGPAEIAVAAPVLAAFYNDSYNRAMMSNTVAFTADDVISHIAELQRNGGRPFFLERNGVLMGDADFRHLSASDAEFAILVGLRGDQGQGLGKRFATLLHAFAFRGLGLDRLFVAIIPANLPSQRLFLRLGYEPDDRPAARRFADDESDRTFSLDRARFEDLFAQAAAEVRWQRR